MNTAAEIQKINTQLDAIIAKVKGMIERDQQTIEALRKNR